MSDFLSRIEAILSGDVNVKPKSRAEVLMRKWVGSVGDTEDLETDDKSSVVAAINEIAESGGGSDNAFVIDYSNPRVDDYTNAVARFNANKEVKLRKGDVMVEMTGYDSTHCFFGGTLSAYLPGGYVIAVYAHIGTNGQNYFWYQYNSPVEAAGLYCEDAGGYFESTNVMGQLQEIGTKLATYPSEVWQGGSYGS